MSEEIDDAAVNTAILLDQAVRIKLQQLVFDILRDDEKYAVQLMERALLNRLGPYSRPAGNNGGIRGTIRDILAELLRGYMPGFNFDQYKEDKYRAAYSGYSVDTVYVDDVTPTKRRMWEAYTAAPTNPKKGK